MFHVEHLTRMAQPSHFALSLPAAVLFSLSLEGSFRTLKIKQQCTRNLTGFISFEILHRKEVIQPHLPIRLPCYDFTPVANPTFGSSFSLLSQVTDFGYYRLPWCDGRCVQGPGTYSPRHADSRLLAIPSSCRRVSACNLN